MYRQSAEQTGDGLMTVGELARRTVFSPIDEAEARLSARRSARASVRREAVRTRGAA